MFMNVVRGTFWILLVRKYSLLNVHDIEIVLICFYLLELGMLWIEYTENTKEVYVLNELYRYMVFELPKKQNRYMVFIYLFKYILQEMFSYKTSGAT